MKPKSSRFIIRNSTYSRGFVRQMDIADVVRGRRKRGRKACFFPGPFPSLSVFSVWDPSSPAAVPLTPFPFLRKAIQLCCSPSKSHITCIHHLAQQYKNVQVTKTGNNNYGNYYFFLLPVCYSVICCSIILSVTSNSWFFFFFSFHFFAFVDGTLLNRFRNFQ